MTPKMQEARENEKAYTKIDPSKAEAVGELLKANSVLDWCVNDENYHMVSRIEITVTVFNSPYNFRLDETAYDAAPRILKVLEEMLRERDIIIAEPET